MEKICSFDKVDINAVCLNRRVAIEVSMTTRQQYKILYDWTRAIELVGSVRRFMIVLIKRKVG
jgi:hypothetical protein